jgi:ABC-type glutathione transport system ATPase component
MWCVKEMSETLGLGLGVLASAGDAPAARASVAVRPRVARRERVMRRLSCRVGPLTRDPRVGGSRTSQVVVPRYGQDVSRGLAIRLRGVVKRYGEITAVAGLDLDVREGTCVGLLGPNGAGKTTTMKMLTAQAIAD